MGTSITAYISKATERTTENFFSGKANPGFISKEKKVYIDREIIIAMNLKGQVEGLVLIGMSQRDALFLAKKAMEAQGFEATEWDDFAQSAILEYANEIMGFTTELLGEEDIECDITIPKFANKKVYEGIERNVEMFILEIEVEDRIIEVEFKVYTV